MQPVHFTRRSLPHWYMPSAAHFVTYRLADTLPSQVLQSLKQSRLEQQRGLLRLPKEERFEELNRLHKRMFLQFDEYLERQSDRCWLQQQGIAEMVRDNLYHHHGAKYDLLAYCIMPNHVHVLLRPYQQFVSLPAGTTLEENSDHGSPLSPIMHSLKSYTANEANRLLGRQGAFWQKESYDHWVRDNEELERIVAYIRLNPVKAGLIERAEDWRYSSTYDRYHLDGDLSGWLNFT